MNVKRYSVNNPGTSSKDLVFHNLLVQCGPSFQVDDYHFIALITSGSARVKWKLQEIELTAPCVCFLGPLEPFGFLSSNGIEGSVIQFKSEALGFNGEIFDEQCATPFIPLTHQQLEYTQQLFTSIRNEFELFDNPDRNFLFLQLRAILSHVIRLVRMTTSPSSPLLKSSKEYAELQTLKDLIDIHYKEHRSPVEYADMLNTSYSSLKKNIKRNLNINVSSIIQQRVAYEARKELALTHKTIKAIAFDLGFQDQFYFSRFFKKVTGTSPDTYRNLIQQSSI